MRLMWQLIVSTSLFLDWGYCLKASLKARNKGYVWSAHKIMHSVIQFLFWSSSSNCIKMTQEVIFISLTQQPNESWLCSRNKWTGRQNKIWTLRRLYSCIHEKTADCLDNCPAALATQAISQVSIDVIQKTMWKTSVILIKTLQAS